jgi:hypothetical protein
MTIYNDELYHYGKLGMKWGKRSKISTTKSSNPKKVKSNKTIEDHITKGANVTSKILQTLKVANEKNKNQRRADEMRKNGNNTSAAITEFANNVAYKTKTDRIWNK